MADELTIAMRLRGARAVNAQLNETAAATNRITAAARRSSAPLGRMGRSLSRTGTFLTRYLTVGLGVAAGLAVKMSLDFDTSMRKIVGLVGVSRKQVEAWKEDIENMSRATSISMDDLANGLYFVTSAGFRGAAAIRVLNASARAAAAGLGDVHTVADAVTSAVNAYGEGTLSAAHATDILVAGVREGKMPVDALAASVGSVLGVASEVGVSFAEVTATAAALSRVGAPVNRTMTGIRFLLANLVNPTQKAEKALKSVHMTADELRKSIRERGLIKTLQDLRARFGDNIAGFLQTVGGARGVIVALGLVGKHSAVVDRILNKTRNSTGSANKAFDEMASGPGFKLRKALNNLKVSMEEFGDSITPAVSVLVTGLSKLASVISGAGGMGIGVVGALILLGPVIKLAAFGFKVAAARAAMATLVTEGYTGSVFAATVAQEGLTAAILASPITWIIAAIALLAIGFYVLFTRVKWFHNAVVGVFNWVKSHWRLLAILIGGPLGLELVLLVNHFKTLKNIVVSAYRWVMKLVHAIGKIHLPGSGILGKAAHGLGAAADFGNKLLGGKADGGPVRKTGAYVVGERGPEIVKLNAGSHVTPNGADFSLRGEVPVQLMLDGKVLAEATARVVADRKARR